MKRPISAPITRSSGWLSGATTSKRIPRARSDAATSKPIKLAPTTTTRFAEVALAMIALLSANVRRGVGTHDGKRPVVALPPQHVGRSQTRGASAHNHDRAWTLRSTLGSRWWDSLTNKNLVAQSFHSPTRDWIKSGCPQRFAIPETETCMVPGTAHGVAHD